MIITHTGKLGDLMFALPVASWIHQTSGEKIHWVLPRSFEAFTKIESLLKMQEMTSRVTLVDFRVQHYKRGGQPYRLIPAVYGIKGEFINLGFRNYTGKGFWRSKPDIPKKFVSQYYADEWGLGIDEHFTLDLGIVKRTDETLQSENLGLCCPVIDYEQDILFNARRMFAARERHCGFSGMAHLLYFARIQFHLYRSFKNPRTEFYFPDQTRYDLHDESFLGKIGGFFDMKNIVGSYPEDYQCSPS